MRRLVFATSTVAFAFSATALAGMGEALGPDAIFARAKVAWRAQSVAPFVQFGLRERYTWRDRVHDNWWAVSYRQTDRALALRRTIVAEQETARMRGTPIALNIRIHGGFAHADSFDTNGAADAFPILDPQIVPNASFGLQRFDQKTALVGALDPLATTQSAAQPAPSPTATPLLAPANPAQPVLREVVRVEAVARDYAIALAGVEQVRDANVYHLTLTPLREPRVYRLRDLWVDTTSFATLQIALDGLFDGEPYADARWLVTYVDVGGYHYIQQIRTDDQLRFGMDRFVSGLQFDFVQYQFPASVDPLMFQRYL